jgi:hypothetical protein
MGDPVHLQASLRPEKSSASASKPNNRPRTFHHLATTQRFERALHRLVRNAMWRGEMRWCAVLVARLDETEINMKPMKSALACLAAAGILLSQPALAAGATRSGSSSNGSEQLAGTPGAALPAIIAILAVAVVAVIASSSNNHHHPASP